jgi:MinD-like ATPase involved in chromosome partitioning or flagellar assembly
MTTRTLALVGAAGGVGTTRLTMECAATLARAGRDVVVVDAAFATQGVTAYLDRQVGSDATALATGVATLAESLYEYPAELPGRLAVCPARAPFERLARAKTPAAAERLGDQVAAASLGHDAVLVDVPPVAANQAVEAIEAVETVAVVTADTGRGVRALAHQRERLADIGRPADAVIANRASGDAVELDADAVVPESDVRAPQACPVCADPDGERAFASAVAESVERLLDVSLDLPFEDGSLLTRVVGHG